MCRDITQINDSNKKLCFIVDDTRDVDPPDDVFLSKMKYLEMSRCWSCTDCDYQSIKPNVRHHVESNHLNLKYRCQICGQMLRTYKSRYNHYKLKCMKGISE